MALTKVGVIYSKRQKVRRVLIVPGDDAQLEPEKAKMRRGEGWLEIPIEVYKGFSGVKGLNQYIENILGKPESDICAVVRGDDVIIDAKHGDPRIDTHEKGVLIQENRPVIGAIYDFVSGRVVLPEEAPHGGRR